MEFYLIAKSPREFEFVTRKISHSVARIKLGIQKELKLGNLIQRETGDTRGLCSGHVVNVAKKPDDFVISTGKQHTVREFVKLAFFGKFRL